MHILLHGYQCAHTAEEESAIEASSFIICEKRSEPGATGGGNPSIVVFSVHCDKECLGRLRKSCEKTTKDESQGRFATVTVLPSFMD